MTTVRIGALIPLTEPGWTDAGHHLLAGLQLAVDDVNQANGVHGRPLALTVRDTAADPARGARAVAELADSGVAAITGEYHSVVARTAARTADALTVPYVCSSAVLDPLVDEPTDWIARMAPAQSRTWTVFADHLLARGHRRLCIITAPGAYWAAGTRILRTRLASQPYTAAHVLDARTTDAHAVCHAMRAHRATALVLLVGFPQPAVAIVQAVRRDPTLADVLIGAPAGQPELPQWEALLGPDGAGIPFLRYVPHRLTPSGRRVHAALHHRLAREPSFVALEGYDSIAVLHEIFRRHGTDRSAVAAAWPEVSIAGTRGPIRFHRPHRGAVWQSTCAPVQVVEGQVSGDARWRVLRTA